MAKRKSIPDTEWFESFIVRIPEAGCWVWTGSISSKGYGRLNRSRGDSQAHRFSWLLHCGSIPESMHVLHRCDTPSCTNPHHLFLGTNQENVDDKMRKRRFKPMIGANHGMAILSDAQVLNIRQLFSEGGRQSDIARMYKIDKQRVYQIVHRKQWRHI